MPDCVILWSKHPPILPVPNPPSAACSPTGAESTRIRQSSWECLACIASGYYDKLPAYMQDIFSLTQQAVGRDEEDVVLQALEFWCTVAEEETDRDGVSSLGERGIGSKAPGLVAPVANAAAGGAAAGGAAVGGAAVGRAAECRVLWAWITPELPW